MSPNARRSNNGSRHPSTSSANSRDSVSDRSSSPTANSANNETSNLNEKHCDIIVDHTNSDAERKSKNIDRFFSTTKCSNVNDSMKYHSIKNRLRNDGQVGRSKSFQEQDVKPLSRYSRFFTSRHHDDMSLARYNKFSSETVSHHNIEIFIEDTDSTDSRSCSCQRLLRDSPILSSHIQNRKDSLTVPSTRKPYKLNMDNVRNVRSGHILGRIFRRMRKITIGWRKSRCRTRRGFYYFFFLCFCFEILVLTANPSATRRASELSNKPRFFSCFFIIYNNKFIWKSSLISAVSVFFNFNSKNYDVF